MQPCRDHAMGMTATPLSLSATVSAPLSANIVRIPASSVVLSAGSRRQTHLVASSGGGGGSCCGGTGGGGGGSCSSHGKSSLTNLGKEFEQLVAQNTLLEFEKNYDSAPMEGKITREIIDAVMNIPEGGPAEEASEKFLDIDEILEEANRMSQHGDLVFSEDPDFVLV